MVDDILIPELRKNYEELAVVEKDLSNDERLLRHHRLKNTVDQIMQLSAIARHVGLLALEEETINNDSLSTMTKELLLLVVDGTESNLVARIGCMQYFATKKDAYQAISDIISIYGVLSIQAGDNPRVIKKMMNAMLPADVAVYESNSTYEVYCDYAFSSATDKKITEIDWASLYQGDICLKSSDKG